MVAYEGREEEEKDLQDIVDLCHLLRDRGLSLLGEMKRQTFGIYTGCFLRTAERGCVVLEVAGGGNTRHRKSPRHRSMNGRRIPSRLLWAANSTPPNTKLSYEMNERMMIWNIGVVRAFRWCWGLKRVRMNPGLEC
jgi:hypothetical protein